MSWTNYHTHCRFCDGVGEPEDYVKAALEQGMTALGFSSHAPLPFPSDWNIRSDELPEYCQTIEELKRRFRDRIDIRLGLEVDFMPGLVGPRMFRSGGHRLDYIIGSIHYLGRLTGGKHWAVDASADQFAAGLRESYGGDVVKLVKTYYRLLRRMLREDPPDIVGHLDVVRINNEGGSYFSEGDRWYRGEVYKTLELVAGAGAVLEVNVGGMLKGRVSQPYPSRWILERCLELDVPLTLSSDAHRPQHVCAGFGCAARLLSDIGFRELHILDEDGWRPRRFTVDGLIPR